MYKGFDTVELQRPKRSTFDLSHDKRGSANMGMLVPIVCEECIPSDVFRGSSEILLRLQPLIAPIFDKIRLYVHYFFVPNRLLWDEWEEFITGGRLGVGVDPLVAPIPPRVDIGAVLGAAPGTFHSSKPDDLGTVLGVPNLIDIEPDPADWNGKFLDLMPFAAYACIWYNYYRDRNFVSDDIFDTGGEPLPLPSGTISFGNASQYFNMRQRSYQHDYFTSALPFTQRGEEVLMPIQLGGLAPLYGNTPNPGTTTATLSGVAQPGSVAIGMQFVVDEVTPNPPGSNLYVRGEDFDGTSTSINDFRSAYALQVWLERNAIGGSRYNESTQAHFGVRPQDSRLQRPEYIGGGVIPVKISEIVSTAWSTNAADNAVPQANMAGHGVTYGNTNRFNYFCAEHGFIVGLVSIMPEASYQQGLPRMFKRGTFLDYPWPTFAKLGEQEVADYEIYCTPASLTPDGDGQYPEFGFQSRYADWKSRYSTNFGLFRQDDGYLFWTLTRIFAADPVLGTGFNEVGIDADDRIFAVGDNGTPRYLMYIHNNLTVKRALPYFGTPNTLGFA